LRLTMRTSFGGRAGAASMTIDCSELPPDGVGPMTRWACPPPWQALTDKLAQTRTVKGGPACRHAAAVRAREEEGHTAALLQMLADDLRRGHWNLDARHYLMVRTQGRCVPAEMSTRCDAVLARCPATRLSVIQEQVKLWSAAVGRSRLEGRELRVAFYAPVPTRAQRLHGAVRGEPALWHPWSGAIRMDTRISALRGQ